MAGAGTKGGFIVWLTGLSGAGKSTLARALAVALSSERPVTVLDVERGRVGTRRDASEREGTSGHDTRRAGAVACERARAGAVAINATVAPLASTRADVRSLAARDGIAFVEIYVEAPPATLIARDPHGLYRRALEGDATAVAGVSAPYEPPRCPEVRIRSDIESVEQSTRIIVRQLERRGLVGSWVSPRTASTRARRPSTVTESPDHATRR